MDFVWAPRRGPVIALECKWSARDFDPTNLKAFARAYPQARTLVIATDAHPPFRRDYDGQRVDFIPLPEAIGWLTNTARSLPAA